MTKLRLLVAAALTAVIPSVAAAQTGVVSGRVTNAQNDQPLASATVTVAGSALRAVTSANGEYRITGVPAGTRQISASVLGFSTQTRTVTVTAGSTLTTNFALNASAIELGALVVSASGQEQRQREIGNAVTQIDVDSINMAPISNITQLLQGRAAGVAVLQSSGTSGTGARIRIRGSNSISLSNDPLLVIDGVRVSSNTTSSSLDFAGQDISRLNDINPEEIESIEVLKGPAASALYGTAAANGVIQITTKRGRSGETRWNVYSEMGSIIEPNEYPANVRQLGTVNSSGALTSNCNVTRQVPGGVSPCTPTQVLSYNPLEDHSPFRDGSVRTFGLSVSGGGQGAQYFVSAESQDENGIYRINELEQINLRGNVTAQVSDDLNLSLKTGYVSNYARLPYNDNAVEGIVSAGLLGCYHTPDEVIPGTTVVPCTTGGYYGYELEKRFAFDLHQRVERFIGSMNARYQPLPWLTLNGTGGMDILNRDDTQAVPPNIFTFDDDDDYPLGYRFVLPALIRNFTWNGSGVGAFSLTPSIFSTTTVGTSFYRASASLSSAGGYNLLAGTNSLNAISERFSIGETNTDVKTLGLYGSQQFAWRDKLFVTAAARGDRNSSFGEDLGFIWYPSLSGSWVIAEEPWFPQTAVLSTLRLRSAYGESGLTPGFRTANQFFSPQTGTIRPNPGDDPGGINTPAVTVGGAGNAALRPERSREVEVGFDAGFLGDRLGLELTYYDKASRDALVSRRLASSLGSSSTQTINLGRVSNKGLEALVNARVLDAPNARWDATVTYSTNKNTLEELGEGVEPIIFGIGGDSQRHEEGFPLGAYFATPIQSFADTNGDGIIALSEIQLGDEAEFRGTPFPKHEASFSSTLTLFEMLRLSALVDHKGGHKLFNSTEEFRCGVLIQCRGYQDRTAPLDEQAAAVARVLTGTYDGYIEDATFTKLRELSLTLMAPTGMTRRFGMDNISLTLSGRNLATWTDYRGLDPELNSGGQSNFNTFDFLGQPPVRHYVARIDLSF